MDYNGLSRRGLIRLNGDYDQASDGKLKEFLDSKPKDTYEAVKPVERMLDKMETSIETVRAAGSGVNEMVLKRAEKLLDDVTSGMANAITEEVDRISEVLDEQKDDEAYPDDDVV